MMTVTEIKEKLQELIDKGYGDFPVVFDNVEEDETVGDIFIFVNDRGDEEIVISF